MDVSAIKEIRTQLLTAQSAGAASSARTVAPNVQQEIPAQRDSTAAQAWNEIVKATESSKTVQIEFDKEINRTVVRVIDGQTKSVVAQIPSEEMVNLMKRFRSYASVMDQGRV